MNINDIFFIFGAIFLFSCGLFFWLGWFGYKRKVKGQLLNPETIKMFITPIVEESRRIDAIVKEQIKNSRIGG
jgi:hypothetical protein